MRLSAVIVISFCLSAQGEWAWNSWDGFVGDKFFANKRVPADSYTVFEAQPRTNPLFGDNDVEYRWRGNSSAHFRNIFLVKEDEFAAERIFLVFQGVDTFASIKLNGHELGNTSNMYLRYAYDVKEYLTVSIRKKLSLRI